VTALLAAGCVETETDLVCDAGFVLSGTECLPANLDPDGDGVANADDNCPDDANPDQEDLDGDEHGDVCDLDDDNDGLADSADNCPAVANPAQIDLDSDGLGDSCDDDDDDDGVDDPDDVCPEYWNPTQADTDGDGVGNDCSDDDDGDGILDDWDNCPFVANEAQLDSDGDGRGDPCQDDADADGIPDLNDNCVDHPNVDQTDSDNDQLGNGCDPDDDNDGISDTSDNCPLTANPKQEDADKNSVGDACDGDLDGDGVADAEDTCPEVADPAQTDYDLDGLGDLCDDDANGDGVFDALSSVEPGGGSDAGGLRVLIEGSGFRQGAEVSFAGIPATETTILSPRRALAITPPGSVGFVDVLVTNADGRTFAAYSGFEYVSGTAVRGTVLDSNLVPIANVVVELEPSGGLPLQAATDSNGRFELLDTPAGSLHLKVNPSLAGVPGGPSYPFLNVPVEIVEGQINEIGEGRPIFLPILDTSHLVIVDPSQPTVVTSSAPSADPSYPGAVLSFAAGTAVDENGSPYSGEILISEVPASRTPISLPRDLAPSYLITVQPAGIDFTSPATITFPNIELDEPGFSMDLLVLDHDTGEFVVTGQLQVDSTGDELNTVTGGVTTSSWGIPSSTWTRPDARDSTEDDGDDKNEEDDKCEGKGSRFDLASGELRVEHRLPAVVAAGRRRSQLFTYSTASVRPQPLLRVSNSLRARGARIPTSDRTFSYLLTVDGQQIGDKFITEILPDLSDAQTLPMVRTVTFDARHLETGTYPVEIQVRNEWFVSNASGNSSTRRFSGMARIIRRNVTVWNQRNSPFGVGWSLSGLRRVHPSDNGIRYLVEEGTGSSVTFQRCPISFSVWRRNPNLSCLPGSPGFAEGPRGEQSTFEVLTDGSFVQIEPDGRVFNYEPNGLLAFGVDARGRTTFYSYDANFRLVEMLEPGGLTTTFTYDGAYLQQVTGPAGRVTRFNHDSSGALVSIEKPDGAVRSFTYDANHLLQSKTNELGEETTYSLDDQGHLLGLELSDGSVQALVPDRLANLADFDQGGANFANPAPVATEADVDGAFADANGAVINYRSNARGQQTSRTGPDGREVLFEYDDNGRLTRKLQPDGIEVLYSWSSPWAERLLSHRINAPDMPSQVTSFTYGTVAGREVMTSATLTNGATTTFAYDAQGNVTAITDELGAVRTFSYDSNGELISQTSPQGGTSTFTRDAAGRLTAVEGPTGSTEIIAYNLAGRVSDRTNALGDTTSYSYDPSDRLASVTDAVGGVTEYTYNAVGRLTGISDAAGKTTSFSHDSRGRMVSQTGSDGQESYEYDNKGHVLAQTNGAGERTENSYDSYGRLISEDVPGIGVTHYEYDAGDRLVRAAGPEVEMTFTHDLLGRLTETRTVGPGVYEAVVANTYRDSNSSPSVDALGNRGEAGISYTNHSTGDNESRRITYRYDEIGEIREISEADPSAPTTRSAQFTHDSAGRRTGINFDSGLSVNYSYSADNFLSDIAYSQQASSVMGWSQSHDAIGNVTEIQSPEGTHNYSHDALGAVLTATHPSQAAESYSYDPVGNRTSSHSSSSYSYDSADRLLEDDSYDYQWDGAGRLVSREDRVSGELLELTWSGKDQLLATAHRDSSGALLNQQEFIYDPLGRRIEKRKNGFVTQYIYDGGNMVSEVTSDGLSINYVYGPQANEVLFRFDSQDDVQYYLRDGSANVAAVVDESGTVLQQYTYDTFGRIVATLSSTFEQPFGLHGMRFDASTGFYFAGARHYDPATGRFLSADTWGGLLAQPRTIDGYVFALNNPHVYWDPTGLFVKGFTFGGSGGDGFFAGAEITIAIDTENPFRIQAGVCAEAGAGIGGELHGSTFVRDGNLEVGNTEFTVSVIAESCKGACCASIKLSNDILDNKFFGDCKKVNVTAKITESCGGISTSQSIEVELSQSSDGGIDVSASDVQFEAKAEKKIGFKDAVTGQVCFSKVLGF